MKTMQPDQPTGMTPFRKNRNGLDNHKTLVESMIKQGAKFRRPLKYGFPVVARKTIFEGEEQNTT